MKRRRSADSTYENDCHRFGVNRKRSVRPATREEEAKFLLEYAKRELNDEKYDKLKKLMIGFLFRSVSTADVISQSLHLVEGDKYLGMGFDYFFNKLRKIDPSLENQQKMDPIMMLMVKDEAEELTEKIEKQLKGDLSTRKRFLNALNSGPLGAETLRKIGVIFRKNEDILKHLDAFSQNPTTYLEQHEGSREAVHNHAKSFHPSSQSRREDKLLGDSWLMKKSDGCCAESSSKERNDAEEGNDILGLDYSTYPRVTQSYVLLPKNDQVPKVDLFKKKGKNHLAALNRQCISVASRETNDSFTTMHHNKYAEELFEDEDKRFELDVLIGSIESAIERKEKRLKALMEGKQTTDKDPLSVKDLRSIEFLYGEHGLEMIETLRENEIKALPSISKRLKRKKKYLEEQRSALKVEQTEAIVEKHKKASDHKKCHYCKDVKTGPTFLEKLVLGDNYVINYNQ